MSIILEGPDGSGKSTLLGQIMELLPEDLLWTSRHYGKTIFREALRDYQEDSPRIVYDRCHLSEQVYGPIVRGKDSLGVSGRRMLDRILLGRNAVVVRTTLDFETSKDVWGTRLYDELISNEEDYDQMFEGYQHLKTDLPVLTYDWMTQDPYDLLRDIFALKGHNGDNLGPGIGSFEEGNILLVGDSTRHIDQLEACFCWDTGSAPWLTNQLESIEVPESMLYWINARSYQGVKRDPGFIDLLQPSKVIALGNLAGKWCKDHQIEHEKVPHPQYWKKFKQNTGDKYPLLTVLEEAMRCTE